MGNCDSCVGGRGHPSHQDQDLPSPLIKTPKPVILKPERVERSDSFFVEASAASAPVNYRIIPADDPASKIHPPKPKDPPHIRPFNI